jgi:preprotein translocase subunit SecA
MLGKMSNEVVTFLAKADLPKQTPEQPVATRVSAFDNSGGAFKNAKEQQRQSEVDNEGGQGGSNNQPQQSQQPKRIPLVNEEPKIGRNDKVELRNLQTGELRSLKFKQAEPLLKTGLWVVTKTE